MSRASSRFRRAAVGVGAAAALVIASLGPPAAEAAEVPPGQPVGFAIGDDGRLYASSLGEPELISSAVMASPGAGLATFIEDDGRVSAFAIGTEGGLVLTAPTDTRPGYTVVLDGPSGLAPPGAPLSGVSAQGWEHIFFVGYSGALYRTVYHRPAEPEGPGPQPWSEDGIALPGAIITAAVSPTSAPGAVFVGSNGGLYSVWQTDSDASTTILNSPPDVAQPGGGVAALATTAGVQTFFTDLDGRLWTTHISTGPLPDPWAPVAITEAGVVPSGAPLTAMRLPNGALAVFFAGADGAIWVAATDLAGSWLEPFAVTPTDAAVPGAPLSLLVDGDYLYSGWCGNEVWWWWRWQWPSGPFPQPWQSELSPVRVPTPGLIRDGFNVSLSLAP